MELTTYEYFERSFFLYRDMKIDIFNNSQIKELIVVNDGDKFFRKYVTLEDYIQAKIILTESDLLNFIYFMSNCFLTLKKTYRVAHRDIKPENFVAMNSNL